MYAKVKHSDGTVENVRMLNYTRELSLSGVPRVKFEGYITSVIEEARVNPSMEARRVIYNGPATIVMWADGTKTVVKCDPEDEQDQMLGLALCYMKKALGNSSRKFNDALHAEGF